jgi:AcrR family transcriptional regulator
MARWEPDAEDRLRRAAAELFVERGYDAVTVLDIALRAGLTRRSFFRYFPDKREVLFAGSQRLVEEVERRLDAAASDESTQKAVVRVLDEAGAILAGDRDRDSQRQRRAIIAASPELQERDRTKIAQIAAAITRWMARRGVAVADAELLGAVCAEAFRSAYNRALSADGSPDFGEHLSEAARAIESFVAPLAAEDAHRRKSPRG